MNFRKAILAASFAVCAVSSSAAAVPPDQIRALLPMFKQSVVQQICQDRGKWLECFSLQASDCGRITGQFVDECLNRYGEELINSSPEKADETGQQLSQCFNKVFLNRYGSGRKMTKECEEPPAHLR